MIQHGDFASSSPEVLMLIIYSWLSEQAGDFRSWHRHKQVCVGSKSCLSMVTLETDLPSPTYIQGSWFDTGRKKTGKELAPRGGFQKKPGVSEGVLRNPCQWHICKGRTSEKSVKNPPPVPNIAHGVLVLYLAISGRCAFQAGFELLYCVWSQERLI